MLILLINEKIALPGFIIQRNTIKFNRGEALDR
jgi:hypothetical protein